MLPLISGVVPQDSILVPLVFPIYMFPFFLFGKYSESFHW